MRLDGAVAGEAPGLGEAVGREPPGVVVGLDEPLLTEGLERGADGLGPGRHRAERGGGVRVVRVGVAERERDQQNRSSAPWLDLSPRVESLVGGFAMGGLGRGLISLLGGDPKVRTLLDTFLGLAPGMIQCLAAVAHRFSESPAALDEVRESDTPSVFSLGGMADSCYVWRKDSYLSKLRTGYPSEEGLSEGGIDQSSDAAREEPGN